MTTPDESQDTNHLTLVVDGDYLYRAFKDVLGRPPTSGDRTDFEELKRYAASMRAEGYFVTARYFQRRQPSSAFYNALERFGYELVLTDYNEPDSWRVVKQNLISELQTLRTTDNDVLYVGGDSYAGEITVALLNLRVRPNGSRRKLRVAHFDRRTDFIGTELETLDLVTDVEAVPPHVYRESDERTRYPEGYLQATQPPQPQQTLPPPPPPAVSLESPFGQQLRQAIHSNPDFTAPPAPQAAPPYASPADAPAGPRNILVLIDHENIDWSLGNLIGPEQLNAETRPRWSELRRFVEQRAAGGATQFISFLQHNDSITGFAVYLDGEEGFRPVLLQSQVDETGRRRPVVDEAIHQALFGLRDRECDVLIVSNDGGYLRHMQELRAFGLFPRQFGVIGFIDEMSGLYRSEDWVETFDLERDVGAFSHQLPRRYMPIAVDDFDISSVLGDFALPGAAPAVAPPAVPGVVPAAAPPTVPGALPAAVPPAATPVLTHEAVDQAAAPDIALVFNGEEDEPAGFKVTLEDYGANRLAVIDAVKSALQIELLAAKRLVERAPVTLQAGLSEPEADRLEDILIKVGATIEVVELE